MMSAGDTTAVGPITDNEEADRRKEGSMQVQWYKDNNVVLNTEKTQDMERVSRLTEFLPAG